MGPISPAVVSSLIGVAAGAILADSVFQFIGLYTWVCLIVSGALLASCFLIMKQIHNSKHISRFILWVFIILFALNMVPDPEDAMHYDTGINYGSAIFAFYLLICVVAVGQLPTKDQESR